MGKSAGNRGGVPSSTSTTTTTTTKTTKQSAPHSLLVKDSSDDLSIGKIRAAIPPHCFRASAARSVAHIVVDVTLSATLAYAALTTIPRCDAWATRALLWAAYGWVQGLLFTGIWILAHECGHGALFATSTGNDSFGFVLHSALMVPYFSWKYTHARHHRYTNHMDKDTAFVPSRDSQKTWSQKVAGALHYAEDAPLHSAVLLAVHQLLGWQAYLLTYASGGEASTPEPLRKGVLANSHLNPVSSVFTKQQRVYALLSVLGMLATGAGLYVAAGYVGAGTVALLYLMPYIWLNNWMVAITYLHHTHPDVHHFESSTWTYIDGALGTVDRPFGFVGEYIFHGIIDYHVVHHLFPSIPFYHAKEATGSIKTVLGSRYRRDETPFWQALWQTFRSCKQVEVSKLTPGILEWK